MEGEVSGLCLGMKLGVILGGNSNSSDSSGEKSSDDFRLARYLEIKPGGSTFPSRPD